MVLNSALCEHHLEHCPLTDQILTECAKVRLLPLYLFLHKSAADRMHAVGMS